MELSALTGILGLLGLIVPIALVVLVIYFILKTIKGFEKRANEKLMLERENTLTLQKRVDELNERLVSVEKILKEVE
ncbi:hypothetical protein BRE01_66970 [Brevibacillus reuszeri]|uniref:Uncharacterized protein n=1 Tax=Brevibacillus reuszeri TaxID=54915 RepID=A0A0K9Z174_9BACL|nr:hypothetical protein [Brevibacillus reuszeri]KNB74215.1 hypothetical protein ADS79_03380 [Brevibacillus reuszeri]MED1859612.1 hypothetical protein [Brevibacillus reuszeri]GED72995.1 hypothetical protein BRE01_66970 [Brevibacillus reuszeri]